MTLTCPLDGCLMLVSSRHDWLQSCPRCGLEGSTLVPEITSRAGNADIAEDVRAAGLGALRNENGRRLLRALLQAGGSGRLLDVGSGPGFFLALASQSGFEVAGVEPDEHMAITSRETGTTVHLGFFPEALPPGSVFEVIVLNDVLEHIPQIDETFAAFRHHLPEGGLLVLNSPDRNGIIYRAARLLDRLGIGAPFRRMWQVGLPSPHVWYFTRKQLRDIAAANGFSFVAKVDLLTVSRDGLYDRIAYMRNQGRLFNLAVFALVWLLAPVMRFLPQDIAAVIVRKNGTVPDG